MRSLLKLRSHVVSTGIHDCRGALVAIRGYSKLLLEGEAGAIAPSQQDYLKIIAENAQKLALSLATLSRIAASEDLVLEDCDFVDLWRQTVRALYPEIAAKSLRVTASFPERPIYVIADRVQLGAALHKILSNAIEFVDSGGEMISAVSASEENVKIVISDPHNVRESSPARPAGWYSPADEIIRLHGGWFSSPDAPGEGLTVTFTLPLL